MFKTFARERVVPWEGIDGIQEHLAESLRRIKKNSSKKLADLHSSCAAALVELEKEIPAGEVEADIRTKIHIIFEPFKLACDEKNVKTVAYALDCIEKLLEYGFLIPSPGERADARQLIDQAVACVSDCFTVPDDMVQLQIVQTLAIGVKARNSGVHEGSLLTAVRTIYNIYLNPKSVGNMDSALEALQAILKAVYKRMETASVEEAMNALDATRSDASAEGVLLPAPQSGDAADPEAVVLDVPDGEELSAPPPIGDVEPEPEQQSEQTATSRRGSVVALERKLGDTSMQDEDEGADTSGATFPNIYQKDGYLLFRALCKLSMKEVTKEQLPDSVPVRSKLQALRLIQSVLETSGPAFRSGEKFAYAIKQYLCLSLLKNCVSPFESVFEISLAVFDNLMVNFIDHLKTELQVFFENIFFRFLESPSSSFVHKSAVLESVRRMCATAQFPVDLYLNYDCDFEGANVYERLITSLSDIARGHGLLVAIREGLFTPQQGQQLELAALETLVTCVSSMVDWCNQCDAVQAKEAEALKTDADDANEDDLEALIEKERGARGKVGKGEQAEMAEQQKRRKDLLVQAVEKFNIKPKAGVLFLEKCELIPPGTGLDAATKLAQLFKETEGFDKTQMGDYMGEGGTPKTQFNVSVLHAFIDTYDFTGMTFSESLRSLLKGFRLPGEAQKIDRVVEKFAERYCSHNPEAFDNADAAYTLAYSVIMLNTDRHNPMVKKKMELEDFLRNNRGINGDGGDLPKEMLTTIFHEIVANEIKMKEDGEDWSKHSGMLTSKQRQQMWQDESDRIIKRSTQMFSSKRSDVRKFHHANEKHHVSLMFKASWCPLLAAFSVIMEEVDDPRIIELVLTGFEAAVHIASTFFMDVERDAFVSTLAKFTLLHTKDKQMKDKHVEAIKTILRIAFLEGDYLEDSWGTIQRAVSQLNKKHQLLDGARDDASFFAGAADTPRGGAGAPAAAQPTREQQEYLYVLPLQDQIDRAEIERIYSNSSNLNHEAVIHFVTHLVKVSEAELASSQPSIFSMQKIVETAEVNMDRVRIVWSQIWKILQVHFQNVGCHDNMRIAMYAIDSLRQLARKFLAKDELMGFDFQQDFLLPFEHIVQNSRSSQTRELVVACLDQIIQTSAQNLKSGWRAVLKVLVVAASDQDEMIVNLGFNISETVMKEHFGEIKDIFSDMAHCIVAFGCNKTNTTVSLAAIRHLKDNLSFKLINGDVIPLPEPSQATPTSHSFLFTETHAKYWFPLLIGIANLVNDERPNVRTAALDALFQILRKHGGTFSHELWGLVFKGVLIPIFDNVRHAGEEDESTDEWLERTCFLALQQLVDLFVHFYEIVVFLLGDVLCLLTNCAEQERENLARFGVACFTRLCVSSGERMEPEIWSQVTDTYAALFENTAPKELLLRTETMDDDAVAAAEAAQSARDAAAAALSEAEEVRRVYEAKMEQLEGMARREGDLQDAAAAARKRAAAAAEAAAEGGAVGGGGGDPVALAEAAEAAETEARLQSQAKAEVQEEARRAAELLATLEDAADAQEAAAEEAAAAYERTQTDRENLLRFRGVRCKCVVQLLLIDSLEEVFFKHGHLLRCNQIEALLGALTRCHEFARNFNADIELRNELWSRVSLLGRDLSRVLAGTNMLRSSAPTFVPFLDLLFLT